MKQIRQQIWKSFHFGLDWRPKRQVRREDLFIHVGKAVSFAETSALSRSVASTLMTYYALEHVAAVMGIHVSRTGRLI